MKNVRVLAQKHSFASRRLLREDGCRSLPLAGASAPASPAVLIPSTIKGDILRYVFCHSPVPACLVGVLVALQAYVHPFTLLVVN